MNLHRRAIQALALLLLAFLTAAQGPAASTSGNPSPQFVAFEVLVDSGATPLAAYQVEIVLPENAKIVGLEGGDAGGSWGGGGAGAFHEAPYYDPAALSGNRIIIAAFSTAEAQTLPAGNVHVARLHLMLAGNPETLLPAITRRLTVAADSEGQSIPATVSLVPFVSAGETP